MRGKQKLSFVNKLFTKKIETNSNIKKEEERIVSFLGVSKLK